MDSTCKLRTIKISGRLGKLRHYGPSLNFHSRPQMFNVFIKPSLIYCLPVWENCPLSCLLIFDTLLLRCAKYVLNDAGATLSQDNFNDTTICNFVNYVFTTNVCTVFKYIHSAQLDNFSTFTSSVSQRITGASLNNKIDAPLFARKADDLFFISSNYIMEKAN